MSKLAQKPRKAYKRCGIVHVCYAGYLYANEADPKSSIFDKGSDVFIVSLPKKQGGSIVVSTDASGRKTETWVPTSIGSTGEKRAGNKGSSAKAKSQVPTFVKKRARGVSSAGYKIFLPPGSGGSTTGLVSVTSPEQARDIAMKVIADRSIEKQRWDLCTWGTVHDWYDLSQIARVEHDGSISHVWRK